MSIRSLLVELAAIRRKLNEFGIRDEAGYAELLVAEALGGQRNGSSVVRGWDVEAPGYGRVEVRSRTLPFDGRQETRLHLPASKRGHFDWFAGVIFNQDLTVREAFLLPHDAAWECARLNRRSDVTLKSARARPEYRPSPKLDDLQAGFDA